MQEKISWKKFTEYFVRKSEIPPAIMFIPELKKLFVL